MSAAAAPATPVGPVPSMAAAVPYPTAPAEPVLAEAAPVPYLAGPEAPPSRDIALVDLLDRLLAEGVVLTGDLTLTIADVDLVHISLRALITSISPARPSPWEAA